MKEFLVGMALAVPFIVLLVVFASIDDILVRVLASVGLAAIAWVCLRPVIVGWLRGLLHDIRGED